MKLLDAAYCYVVYSRSKNIRIFAEISAIHIILYTVPVFPLVPPFKSLLVH
jgi:hypothetical protein